MASIDRTDLLRLYRTLGPALALYARTWLDGAAAQDAVQDAFVAMFNKGRGIENPRAWLYAAVRNRAIALSRSDRRRERRERRAGPGEVLVADQVALVDKGVVLEALDALQSDAKEIVVLRVWGELTFEEVGRICGVSPATAFRRYEAALEAIRRMLEESCTRRKK
jgi:RNA polymerase sigma-70 factor (ECF subfamily)